MNNLLKAKSKSYHIILILATIAFFSTIIFGFVLYMPTLRYMVKLQKALKPGNEMRDFYLKLPIPLDFRVYLFNVTNPEEVREGRKPVLQEVGPFCYDAYKEKINIEEDNKLDTLTYSPYETYFFNQTRSGQLSPDDYVTIINPLIVGIINAVADQKPQFLSTVNKAFPIIFKESYDIYLTVRVRDILFDGVTIDCRVKDFSATAVCSQFKGQPVMVEAEKNVYLFSLFGTRNGTLPKRITVKRGIKNGDDIGRVVLVDNQTDLGVWPAQECNEYHGTDGWIFPSFLKKEDGIWTVASDLCRSFKATFVEDAKLHGVSVRKYYADLGDMSSNPEEKCFCPKPDSCLPKGVMDLTKCMKVPIYCTLPHFLNADEQLLEQVEGLHPDKDKHIIQLYFEPVTGTPMIGQRRIQFNFKLRAIPKISIMKTVPEALHPMLWLEEGVELEGDLLKKITTVSTILKVTTGVRYAILLMSLEFIAYGCYKIYKDWKMSKVSPVENASGEEKKKSSDEDKQEEIVLQPVERAVIENNLKNSELTNGI